MGDSYHSLYMHGQSIKRDRHEHHRGFDIDEYQYLCPDDDHRPLGSYLEDQSWTYLGCPFDDDDSADQRDPHTDAIMIQAHGVCHDNEKPWASGGPGVFSHHDNHRFNRASLLPPNETHTSHCAQLYACREAILLAKEIWSQDTRGKLCRDQKKSPLLRLHHVVIKTNSDHASKSMCDYVWKWEGNGYTSAKSQSVVNGALFREMQQDTAWLEARSAHVDF